MYASRLWSFYSIKFQIWQIPATNQHFFSGNNNPFIIKPYCCVGLQVDNSEKKKCFSSLRSCYHKLANRNKLILYFTTRNICKILNDVTIGTASKKLLESFTIFQYGQNNGVKIWGFDASRNISRHRKLPLILILQMQ